MLPWGLLGTKPNPCWTKEVSLSKADVCLQSRIVSVPDSPLGRGDSHGAEQARTFQGFRSRRVSPDSQDSGARCVAVILPLVLSKPCPFQVSRGCGGPSPRPGALLPSQASVGPSRVLGVTGALSRCPSPPQLTLDESSLTVLCIGPQGTPNLQACSPLP